MGHLYHGYVSHYQRVNHFLRVSGANWRVFCPPSGGWLGCRRCWLWQWQHGRRKMVMFATSMDWFCWENLNRKPSIFPWRSWGFPVICPLVQCSPPQLCKSLSGNEGRESKVCCSSSLSVTACFIWKQPKRPEQCWQTTLPKESWATWSLCWSVEKLLGQTRGMRRF